MLTRALDRGVFWPLPGWIKGHNPSFPFHSFRYRGMEVWYAPGADDGPTVVFCHGNSGNLRAPRARGERFETLHELGAHLWAFDYRGYGKSPGTPSEESFYQDARAVHDLARHYHPQGRPFVLFGRSLGGAVATYLATEVQQTDLLILESTFTSVLDVAESYTSRRLSELMTYRFDSASRISKLQAPLRMIHGTADLIVPYRLGLELYEACGSDKDFLSIPGAGHNDLQVRAGALYRSSLGRWLARPGFVPG